MVIESHLSTLLYITLHYITLQVTGLVGRADLLAAIFMLLAFRAGDRSDSSNYLHFLSLPYFFECQRKIVWSIKVSSIKYRECPWHWSDIFAVFPPARKIRLFPWSSRSAQVHCLVSTQHSSRSEQLPRSLDFCNHFGAKLSSRIGNHAIRAIYSLLSLT